MGHYSTIHIYIGKQSEAEDLESKMRLCARAEGFDSLNAWIISELKKSVAKTIDNQSVQTPSNQLLT